MNKITKYGWGREIVFRVVFRRRKRSNTVQYIYLRAQEELGENPHKEIRNYVLRTRIQDGNSATGDDFFHKNMLPIDSNWFRNITNNDFGLIPDLKIREIVILGRKIHELLILGRKIHEMLEGSNNKYRCVVILALESGNQSKSNRNQVNIKINIKNK